eukprot:3038789-Ditylum_brightwellii.AAC.1
MQNPKHQHDRSQDAKDFELGIPIDNYRGLERLQKWKREGFPGNSLQPGLVIHGPYEGHTQQYRTHI